MSTTLKISIAVVLIAVVGAMGYVFWGGKTEPAEGTLSSDGMVSPQAGQDIIALIGVIKGIDLNQTIFSNPAFVSLTDYTTPIPTQPTGRTNPFAPLSGGASAQPAAVKKTTTQ